MSYRASDLALGWLTIGGTDPFNWLRAAQAGGFGSIGVKIAPRPGELSPPLLGDAGARQEFDTACRQAGIGLLNMGSIWLDGTVDPQSFAQAMDVGAALGARFVVAISVDPHPARRITQIRQLAEMARARRMRLTIEFFAYSAIPRFSDSLELTATLGQDNVGVLFDALHFHRAGGVHSAISERDSLQVDYFQLCDAPLTLPEGMTLSEEGRTARLFPGEGGIPLQDIIKRMKKNVQIEVEIPHRAFKEQSVEARGQEAMRRSLLFLGQCE